MNARERARRVAEKIVEATGLDYNPGNVEGVFALMINEDGETGALICIGVMTKEEIFRSILNALVEEGILTFELAVNIYAMWLSYWVLKPAPEAGPEESEPAGGGTDG